MRHLAFIAVVIVTCALAVIINVDLSQLLGVNFFTMKLWFAVPAGAVICGLLAASGVVVAARSYDIRPTRVDVFGMVVIAAVMMPLIYYVDYTNLILADGRKARDVIDFATYVNTVLTKPRMLAGRWALIDAGEVGRWGYALAVVEFLGFLLGGAATFVFILELPRCAECESYLGKLKTKKSPELTFDEVGGLLEMFRKGDRATLKEAIGWTPPARLLGPEKAVLTFDLYGCRTCEAETVIVSVVTSRNNEWKEAPSLKARRCLAGERSLRDQFVQE